MPLSLKPEHLKRYKDIARLLVQHGRGDLVKSVDAEAALGEEAGAAESGGDPEKLAKDLEELGPTFIKLGQLLSTRSDLLPAPYLDALARLQDKVEPFSFAEVEEIVSSELGVRLSKAFEEFESEPLAAASLGQVHRARMRDGRQVAVKVQRPGIQKVILEDLEAFEQIAGVVDRHTDVGRRFAFQDILDEFRKTLLRELDYRREAQNLTLLATNLKAYDRLVIPRPVDDYTTSRVLTMDYVKGTKITDLSPLARIDIDGRALAEDLCRAYLDQILVDGFFHADPHPGNLLVTDDGRLALLDLGMVARLEPVMQERLLKLLLAVTEGRGQEAAQLTVQIGTTLEDYDEDRYRRQVADLVGSYQNVQGSQIQAGKTLIHLARLSAENGVRPAPELTMMGRALLQLDEAARTLDPDFDPNQTVRRYSDSLMTRHMLKKLSPGSVFASVLELQEFAQQLPGRMNSVLDNLAGNKLQIKVNAFDEARLMDNLQKIANRIALGLVLAALIVGAALLMQVQTRFRLFGYPGLAMLLFLLAAACGFALILTIFLNDDWRVWRKSPR
ncbi:MAG TPA: AarF/ABC1/UbiB kinase family protein [Thermoanaerobaculia bacterium]|jgi:predicted unusual protein kinase regulating ubiquinone biosynthesis (AarF/ABC1/UbiB family)|nr:AarF/ABC1/UbiB kinase family protein [Thermoanaerobaculia bacterium]